jgi:hypothetical protein
MKLKTYLTQDQTHKKILIIFHARLDDAIKGRSQFNCAEILVRF